MQAAAKLLEGKVDAEDQQSVQDAAAEVLSNTTLQTIPVLHDPLQHTQGLAGSVIRVKSHCFVCAACWCICWLTTIFCVSCMAPETCLS